MKKFYFSLLILCSFSLNLFAQDRWVEHFYECLCYSGERIDCLRQIQSQFPDFREPQENREESPLLEPSILLSQVRAAQLILDQRARSRSEERACLEKAKNTLGHALLFSLKERMARKQESQIFIEALHRLSKEVFQWAEQNCFNRTEPTSERMPINLPNPKLCRPSH